VRTNPLAQAGYKIFKHFAGKHFFISKINICIVAAGMQPYYFFSQKKKCPAVVAMVI
jgi:hypothetical protein